MPAQTWVEPVILTGRRVRMEPLRDEHFAGLCAVAFDAPVWRWTIMAEQDEAGLRRWVDTALANATHYMVMFGGAVPGFVPSDASHQIAHDAFGGLVAKVARCTDAGLLVGRADDSAEVIWGSIHGLVMLELVGIDPLGSDPSARFSRALDALFDGFSHG